MKSPDEVRKRLKELSRTINPGHFVYTYPPHKIYPKITDDYNPLDAWEETPESELNIYFHIPFCRQKCGYCNIESIAISQDSPIIDDYLDMLSKEMQMYKETLERFNVITVYVGGGTPSYLSEEQLQRFFQDICKEIKDTSLLNEFCIELSPDSTNMDKLKIMSDFGINRVSLGVQSFNEGQIKNMGRRYRSKELLDIFDSLESLNFDNINIDIIYGHPDQSLESFEDSIKKTMDLKPGTVSIYPLNIKPLTSFWKKIGPHGLDREKIAKMYKRGRDILLKNGYIQDTRLRFILPKVGRYMHKDETIKGKPVKGFGSAAQSYAEKVHYRPSYSVGHCRADINEYINDLKAGRHPARFAFFLNDDELIRRSIIMNIRHANFNTKIFYDKFGTYPETKFPSEFEVLYGDGYIVKEDGTIHLTERGFEIANSISKLFFSDQVLDMQKKYRYE